MITAKEWQALTKEVFRLGHVTAQPPLEVRSTATGLQIRYVQGNESSDDGGTDQPITLNLVTDVCFDSKTVQFTPITLPSGTLIGTTFCDVNPTDCCGGSGSGSGCDCTTLQCLGVAIYIGNENAVADDDFSLSFNGSNIATITETDTRCETTTCRGHLVLPSSLSGRQPSIVGKSLFPCQGVNINLQYLYSSALNAPLPGFNSVELKTINNNGCGNFGVFRVYKVCCVGNVLELCPIVDSFYQSALTNPLDEVYNFIVDCTGTVGCGGTGSGSGSAGSGTGGYHCVTCTTVPTTFTVDLFDSPLFGCTEFNQLFVLAQTGACTWSVTQNGVTVTFNLELDGLGNEYAFLTLQSATDTAHYYYTTSMPSTNCCQTYTVQLLGSCSCSRCAGSIPVVPSCGGSGGGGTGSGGSGTGGGGVESSCCGGGTGIPTTLHLTLSSSFGCTCWNGSYPLVYAGSQTWSGAATVCGGNATFTVVCNGNQPWTLTILFNGSPVNPYNGFPSSFNTCPPLLVNWTSQSITAGCSGVIQPTLST